MGEDIYQKFIMEHARNPRNVGRIKGPSSSASGGLRRGKGVKKIEAKNPFCGDEADIYLKIKKESAGLRIEDIKYEIQGCILSRAALSILSEHIKGKSASEVAKIKDEDVFKMVGGSPSPSRQKCVLFGLESIRNLLFSYSHE